MKTLKHFVFIVTSGTLLSCTASQKTSSTGSDNTDTAIVKPVYITDTVQFDTDDPAVWINPKDASQSLIIGTDKDKQGGLYVFNLEGKIIPEKTVKGLQRPNNVDIAYGLILNGKQTDIAVTTERMTHKLRIFSLPDMQPVDNGGVEVFTNETAKDHRDLMGIALYTTKDGKIYAIVGRKTGPTEGSYLWQYLLADDGTGYVKATLVRKFGKYSGKKEIEAIAVDNELGYVYYSDEQAGVRQYFADPEKGNEELAFFGTTGFAEDHEGISIYKLTDSTGYILVSDQGANRFQVFRREGVPGKPYEHPLLKIVNVQAQQSDGSEMISIPLNKKFRHGLFIAMSDDKTFHLYRWEDIAGKELQLRK
ncbi:MAG: phytase [Chitinophagaceae bacterium]